MLIYRSANSITQTFLIIKPWINASWQHCLFSSISYNTTFLDRNLSFIRFTKEKGTTTLLLKDQFLLISKPAKQRSLIQIILPLDICTHYYYVILHRLHLISLKFDLPNGIQLFCFPDAHYWSPNNEESLEHFLVLTDPDGTRRFAYSRRILDMPLAYCILTSKQSKLYPMVNNFQCQCCQLCYLPFSINK